MTFLSVSKFLHSIFQPLFLLNQATKFFNYFNRKSIVDHNGSPAHGKIVILIMLFFFLHASKTSIKSLVGIATLTKTDDIFINNHVQHLYIPVLNEDYSNILSHLYSFFFLALYSALALIM